MQEKMGVMHRLSRKEEEREGLRKVAAKSRIPAETATTATILLPHLRSK
jgi:hypothetical protein